MEIMFTNYVMNVGYVLEVVWAGMVSHPSLYNIHESSSVLV